MTHDELKAAMMKTKKPLPDNISNEDFKQVQLVRAFWLHTGVSQKFFLSLPEEEAMKMWAKFVIERIAEVS